VAIAALALIAGYLLLKGEEMGRVCAFFWAMFVIVQAFLILRLAPWFGLAAIIVATLVLYAVSVPPSFASHERA
jgi:hypothetical protein